MSDRCDHCGQVHPTNAAVAIGRFDPRGPSGWRANHAFAEVRATRAEAEADWCESAKERWGR